MYDLLRRRKMCAYGSMMLIMFVFISWGILLQRYWSLCYESEFDSGDELIWEHHQQHNNDNDNDNGTNNTVGPAAHAPRPPTARGTVPHTRTHPPLDRAPG